MMTQAFYTGLSGLKSSSQAIDVISDNLANTATIGYRGYSAEFSNMFEEAINTNTKLSTDNSSIGVGTKVNSIAMNESQGILQISDRSTDIAILGDGWFGVQAGSDPVYTRDGSFNFDVNRDLVTQDGYYVLGTMGTNMNNGEIIPEYDADGNLANPSVQLGNIDSQEKLRFPSELTYPALPTTKATFGGNLSFTEDEIAHDEAALAEIAANIIDPNDEIALDRASLSMSSLVIAQDGTKNKLRLGFTKVEPQVAPGSQWNVIATVESIDGENIYSTQTGVVSFDEIGAQISNTLTSIDNQGTSVEIDLGTEFSGIIASSGSQFSSSSSANGLESGDLFGYDINKNGEVVATFSNGMQSNVGTIAVYHFPNDRGLERISGARFVETPNSGEAMFFQDENGNNILGTDLINFKLESSNVDMTVGLTDLIIMQRSYDANSKSITTADEMLKKALDMDA
ncbi:MAG: flagellar hook-basal body complex protein [Sulfurimonas sp.]|uniref:flagellar hook protein FlgE n=1 Tax=Sulfurimonas sp. TaxID=2022749 RepID=UPI00260333F2|nr:flagellar hook-basal body complex protein [Sulfurimonas sp.]MCW8894558.1 flagellar hook-basal body complex protein [Sulfurimonas sp.]MCW8953764.1 flagellar hook-basal body complex protein [Sulfurimonas sp.]MCW9068482.1 flagellar hook-basal body complex protein [Sulfurimonas sp.]